MVSPETPRRSYKSTHKIEDIVYEKDYLLCLCGWKGRAYDRMKGSPDFDIKSDWPNHRRTAPPITETMDKLYKGKYNRAIVRPAKEGVAA